MKVLKVMKNMNVVVMEDLVSKNSMIRFNFEINNNNNNNLKKLN